MFFFFLTDSVEASSPKDEAADKSQGTPPSTQSDTQSSSDFGGLSPITPANEHGLPGGMTLFDLIATPPERKVLIFETHEVAVAPYVNPAKEIFDDLVQKESEREQDTVAISDEMNFELKEHAKKFEEKLVKDMLKIPRTKRSAK
jgi:hypothetical protein